MKKGYHSSQSKLVAKLKQPNPKNSKSDPKTSKSCVRTYFKNTRNNDIVQQSVHGCKLFQECLTGELIVLATNALVTKKVPTDVGLGQVRTDNLVLKIWKNKRHFQSINVYKPTKTGFSYMSDNNDRHYSS